jgi:hypothetical protein
VLAVTIALDRELISTDALIRRWFRLEWRSSPATLHPLEKIRLLHDGAVFGGGVPGKEPADLAACSEIMDDLKRKHRRAEDGASLWDFAVLWYDDAAPIDEKARRQEISRATLYRRWRSLLIYFRERLRVKGASV